MSNLELLPKIIQLDPLLINQIAAGEVVTRPSSIVKELIENSIDAAATQIDIVLNQGGIKTISVQDNGHGISKESLPLAVATHATSKLTTTVDLQNIASLGFRGEALASTASVSHLDIVSSVSNSGQAWRLSSIGGRAKPPIPCAGTKGTLITMTDLFFNIPARRKFLKTANTEFHHCANIIKQALLSNFNIGFSLTHNNKLIYRLPVAESTQLQQQRIATLCSQEFMANSLYIDSEHGKYALSGYTCLPTFASSKADLQFVFINGRMVKDKLITQAVRSAYQDVLYRQKYPAFILYLNMPYSEVDVNVHPAKTEVRFVNPNFIYKYVSNVLVQALEKNRPQDKISATTDFIQDEQVDMHKVAIDESNSVPSQQCNAQGTVQQTGYKSQEQDAYQSRLADTALVQKTSPSMQQPLIQKFFKDALSDVTSIQKNISDSKLVAEPVEHNNATHARQDTDIPALESNSHPLGYAICQLHNTYILAESKSGLVIVETHAAHERIIYEKMKQQYHASQIEQQKLLLPINIKLNDLELDFISDNPQLLVDMGFEYILGRSGINLTAVPAILKDADFDLLLSSSITKCLEYGDINRVKEHINVILGNMACKRAVKSNNNLNLQQMNALLRDVENTQYSSQCNHGRPTWVIMQRKDIDKLFLHGT